MFEVHLAKQAKSARDSSEKKVQRSKGTWEAIGRHPEERGASNEAEVGTGRHCLDDIGTMPYAAVDHKRVAASLAGRHRQ